MCLFNFPFIIFSIITKQNMTSILLFTKQFVVRWTKCCDIICYLETFDLSYKNHRIVFSYLYIFMLKCLLGKLMNVKVYIFWSFGWRFSYKKLSLWRRFSCLGFILSSLYTISLSLSLMIITWYLCSSLFCKL